MKTTHLCDYHVVDYRLKKRAYWLDPTWTHTVQNPTSVYYCEPGCLKYIQM